MTIQERISTSNLSPSDIVKLSGGRIRMNQASLWLRKMNFSLPTEIMLEYMCKEKDANGVESGTVGRPSLSGKKERSNVIPPDAIMQSIGEKRETTALEKPAKELIPSENIAKAVRVGAASMPNMTFRKANLNGVPCLKFSIDGTTWAVTDLNAKSFSAGGKVYSVSDFKEVE